MRQPEAKFKSALVEGFETLFPSGFRAYTKALDRDGLPDLFLAASPGRRVWVEAKVGDNDLSKGQFICIHRMRAAGEHVMVARFVNPVCRDGKAQEFRLEGASHQISYVGRHCLKAASFWNFLFTGAPP